MMMDSGIAPIGPAIRPSRLGGALLADGQGTALLLPCQFQEVGMVKKRIGILTGGGDVPGLNAVIKRA